MMSLNLFYGRIARILDDRPEKPHSRWYTEWRQ